MSSTGGGGYAPAPGGLGATPNITGEPAPETPPPATGSVLGLMNQGAAPVVPPAAPPDPNAMPPASATAGPEAPAGAPLGLMDPPPAATPPVANPGGAPAPAPGGTPSGIPAGALDTGLPEAAGLARSIARNNADLNRRQNIVDRDAMAAERTAGDIAVEKAKATAEAEKIVYQQQVQQQGQEATRRNEINSDLHRRLSEADNILQTVNSTPFDPNRYVDNLNVGQRLMTAISVGLGALGDAGGHNVGLDMLNRAIEGDVQAQKAQYERGMNLYNAKKSAYQMAREAGMDEMNATHIANLDALETAKQGIKVAQGRFAPAEAAANRDKLLAHCEGESLKSRKEMYSNFATTATASFNTVAGRADQQFNRAIALGHLQVDQQGADAKLAAAEAKANGKAPMSIPHWKGVAATPDAYNKAAEAVGTEHILTRKLTEMADYADASFHGKTLDVTEAAKVSSTASQVKTALKDKFKLGVMSVSDEKLLDSVAADPNRVTVFTEAQAAQLRHLIQQMQSDTDDQLEAYGFVRDNDPKYKPDFQEDKGAR